MLEKESPLPYNFDTFLKEFAATFGEADREEVADTKIRSLRQGLHLASTYATKFRQLACDVDWNENDFISQFRYGLRDNMKDLLLTMPQVNTLSEFITQAIVCDNRLFEKCQEKRFEMGLT